MGEMVRVEVRRGKNYEDVYSLTCDFPIPAAYRFDIGGGMQLEVKTVPISGQSTNKEGK